MPSDGFRFEPDDGALEDLFTGPEALDFLDVVGEAKAELAKAYAPKRTGFGASHIDHEVDTDSDGAYVRVGYQGPGFYLAFQELGTERFPPQPHLRPALDEDLNL